jgi:hypothetical protein
MTLGHLVALNKDIYEKGLDGLLPHIFLAIYRLRYILFDNTLYRFQIVGTR